MSELEGWGAPLKVGQIRMDVNAKLAIVTAITVDTVVLSFENERKNTMAQFVPVHLINELTENTWSLGDL